MEDKKEKKKRNHRVFHYQCAAMTDGNVSVIISMSFNNALRTIRYQRRPNR